MPVKQLGQTLRRHGTVGKILPDPLPAETTAAEKTAEQPIAEPLNFDTDEWDGSRPFWQHAVAGSAAGLAEHSVMFPVDSHIISNIENFQTGPVFFSYFN